MRPTGDSPRADDRPERIRVLHVDDDPAFAAQLAAGLEREDDRFETTTATTAREGLARLETDRIDCLVSEYDLADTDGLALLERVRDRDERVPFVLCTDSGSEALASDAIAAGVTDYVQKETASDEYPVLANRLVNAVETARSQRHHERQRRAIETAREGISLLDPDGTFVYVNRAYAECFGYEPAELIGEHWELLYTDEDAATVREEVLPTVRAEGYWHDESTGVRADGSRIVVDHTLSTTDRNGLICTLRDVTDHRDRERDLERYETIVEALGDPVYTIDSDGRYAFVNDAYAEITGYAKRDIIGQPVSFLLDEPSVERGTDVVRELLSSGSDRTQQTYEITVETSDGTRIQCEDNVSLLPLEDGQYRGAAGVVRDITVRTERERELEQYETILKAIPDEVYVLDADGRFTNVIPPVDADLTSIGYSPDEQIGEHVSLVIDDGDIKAGESIIAALLADDDRERDSYEITLHTKDGDRVPTENHLALLPMEDGEFRGTVGVLRDITERKERERTLERQNERLESFASVVSHDLRNPLNVAQGQLSLVQEGRDDDRLETVAEAHDRMQGLIDGILTLAREEKPITDYNPIELAVFARRCWRHVETGSAALETPTDAVVRVDGRRFERLLENLIRNAVEHGSTIPRSQTPEDAVEHSSTSPASQAHQDAGRRSASSKPSVADAPEDALEHGVVRADQRGQPTANGGDPIDVSVTVTVGDLPDGEGFFVEDDGRGIPSDERERVLESGYSTATEGTGFGLAIVDRIATSHGWSVTVTDSDAGGARFEFRGVDSRR
ncbi:PAS domain S-box protein [Natronorubrum texcoconense]|uniref:histidine kinase n=1 Tax=Natronorubrum texcoconense TaxID=1095776 RepID=A0A1G8SYY6_9EURY|nr:PAS domain S-box protein [Natronorubrum texcoconense]SDJ33750.1 PAS domain S-box-containing protein [Natronorubrum texcoconense]